MTFQPVVGQELEINKIIYHVAEHPAAPGIPYGQEGRQAVVYKLLCEEGDKAFKVFKSRFRTPAMVTHADQIEQYSTMQGLRVCRRTVLTSRRHTELLRQYPDLTYAVLMPWVEGPTWQEIILEKRKLTPRQSLLIVRALAEVLVSMEERGIAHCDLSGANLILNPDLRSTELVDVEGIYSSDLPRPKILPAGSPGYAHETAPKGLWDPDADRFAGAVLLSEVLGWCDEVVREKAWGESYFNPRLIQQDNESYKLFFYSLQRQWGEALSQLFARAWNSDTLAECPTFGEWWVALPTEVPEIGVREKAVVSPVPVEEELEPEPEPVPLAPEPELLCPHCGNMVPGGMDTCAHCEKDIDWVALDRGVLEPKRKRKVPVWARVGIGILIIGLALIGLVIGGGGAGMLSWLATETPIPTSSPIHTNTPTPTSTPIPTNTPTPTTDSYIIRAENIEYVEELVRFEFPDMGKLRSAAWSPQGNLLAIGDCIEYDRWEDYNHCTQGGIIIWDSINKKEKIKISGCKPIVTHLEWSQDSSRLVSFSRPRGGGTSFQIWDTTSWELLYEVPYYVWGVRWSTDGSKAAFWGDIGDVNVLDVSSGEELFVLKYQSGGLYGVVLSSDGSMLAARWGSGEPLRIWNVSNGEEVYVLKNFYYGIWSPDVTMAVSWDRYGDSTGSIWDVWSGEQLGLLEGVLKVVWSPDANMLAALEVNNEVSIWDVGSLEKIYVLEGVWYGGDIVTWSPDGNLLVKYGDHSLVFWDTRNGEIVKKYNWGFEVSNPCLAWSPDGELLVVCGIWFHLDSTEQLTHGRTLAIWDRRRKEFVGALELDLYGNPWSYSISWSPDGKKIAIAGYYEVSIWGIPEP